MATLYLFCLVVGGGMLLVSLFIDEVTEADGPDASDGHGAAEFLSVRTLLYFLAGFGGTGFLLETLTDAPRLIALVWALATGITVATAAAVLYGWLKRSESGLVPQGSEHLVGLPARVVVPVTPDHLGKVVAIHHGREVELLARLYGSSDPECPRGSTVVVVEVDGGTALVTPASFLPTESQ